MFDMGGDEIIRLMMVLLIFMMSMLYCYFITSNLPKGKLTLLFLLPIFCLFSLLPFYFSSFILTTGIGFSVAWLTTFKLIQFSFDSGPLASDPPLPFPLFTAIAFFPARISHNKTTPCAKKHSQEPTLKWPLNLLAKVVIFVVLSRTFLNCALLYFYINMVLSLSNAFVQLIFGVEVKPPFNEPFLATSLQNFWGRRWNLLVSETLHNTVYKPVRYRMGSPRWAAVITVFVVSGMMHELLNCYMTRENPTWEPMLYFVIHGVCVAVEIELKRMFGKKWRLHWIVSGLLTMTFVIFTSNWLLFPPLLRMGKENYYYQTLVHVLN